MTKKTGGTRCTAVWTVPLSCPWEYEQADSIEQPFAATLQVVLWQNRKRMLKKSGVKTKTADAILLPFPKDRKSGYENHTIGEFGPYMATLHLQPKRCTIDVIAHEVFHAVGALPKKAGRAHHHGARGEVAAYRLQRLVGTILGLLESEGIALDLIGTGPRPPWMDPETKK